MVSSKCGRLMVAAGLPAAAAGLTLAVAGTASAAPIAPPVVHVIKLSAEVSCEAHPTVLAPQAHTPARTPEQTRPVTAPVVVHLRPVDMPERFPTHLVAHAPEQTLPKAAPASVTIRPVVCSQEHAPEQTRPATAPVAGKGMKVQPARPEHVVVSHALADPLEAERHEGFKVQAVHQTVTLKIETTAFVIAGQEGSERSN